MERIKTLEEESGIDVSGMVETETINPRHTSNDNVDASTMAMMEAMLKRTPAKVDDEISDAVIQFAESRTYETYNAPHSLNGKEDKSMHENNIRAYKKRSTQYENNFRANRKRSTQYSCKRRTSEVNLDLPPGYPRLEATPDGETNIQRQKRFARFRLIIKTHEKKYLPPLPSTPPSMVVSSEINLNLRLGYPRLDATPDGETKLQRSNRFLRFKRHTEAHEEKLKSGYYEQPPAPKTIRCVHCNNIYYTLRSVTCHEKVCHKNLEVTTNWLREENPEVKRNRKEEVRKYIEEEEHRLVERKRKKVGKQDFGHSEDWVKEQFGHMQEHRVTELKYPPPIYDYTNNRTYHETCDSLSTPSLNGKGNQPVDAQNTHDNEDNVPSTGTAIGCSTSTSI